MGAHELSIEAGAEPYCATISVTESAASLRFRAIECNVTVI